MINVINGCFAKFFPLYALKIEQIRHFYKEFEIGSFISVKTMLKLQICQIHSNSFNWMQNENSSSHCLKLSFTTLWGQDDQRKKISQYLQKYPCLIHIVCLSLLEKITWAIWKIDWWEDFERVIITQKLVHKPWSE